MPRNCIQQNLLSLKGISSLDPYLRFSHDGKSRQKDQEKNRLPPALDFLYGFRITAALA